jgi:hypothetical protein
VRLVRVRVADDAREQRRAVRSDLDVAGRTVAETRRLLARTFGFGVDTRVEPQYLPAR